jgi:hypothetical protein
MKNNLDILIFVEDPGAANMAMDLPDLLNSQGCRTQLLAMNHAVLYLRVRQVKFSTIAADMDAGVLLDSCNPRLLVIGTSENPDSIGLDLIDQARLRNIPSIALVDMACNAERRFRGRGFQALNHPPDQLIVPDTTTKDSFLRLGYPNENILNFGNPQYDRAWRCRRELEGAGRSKFEHRKRPRWVFVAEGFDLLNPGASLRSPEYTLLGRGDTDWRTGIVLEEILDQVANLHISPEIVVRLHPKSIKEDFSQWADEVSFDDSINPLLCVWEADVVLGMTSMLLLEAAILGRPVLSILPRESEKAWLGPLLAGHVACVCDRNSIARALSQLSLGAAFGFAPESWAKPNAAKNISDYMLSVISR